LIQIKATAGYRPSLFKGSKRGGDAMPTETAIVIAGIVLTFAVFAISLAWADYYTRGYRAPESKHF
jgi:hypothetical protein